MKMPPPYARTTGALRRAIDERRNAREIRRLSMAGIPYPLPDMVQQWREALESAKQRERPEISAFLTPSDAAFGISRHLYATKEELAELLRQGQLDGSSSPEPIA